MMEKSNRQRIKLLYF